MAMSYTGETEAGSQVEDPIIDSLAHSTNWVASSLLDYSVVAGMEQRSAAGTFSCIETKKLDAGMIEKAMETKYDP